MKIFFSPEYSGNVYIQSGGKNVMMDSLVVNTMGLIAMLELRLGLHYEDTPEQERVAHYYESVCQYMKAHPDNVMAASFKTTGLCTAKAMLSWRDELRSTGWNFDGEEISPRLAALIGVEEYFCKVNGCDVASRLHIVTDQVAMQQLDCKEWTLVLPVSADCLKPMVKRLIEALEARGAKVELTHGAKDDGKNLSKVRQLIASKQQGKIRLDERDESILIYKFEDDRTACEYLAYNKMEEVDVWVNTDNKQMDNWMMLMGRPLTGSVTADCVPQLTQLFVMGLGLFATPLNVNTLIEWLNMPIHPIERYFRGRLADTIVTEGGYRNDACKDLIEKYIAGEFIYLSDKEKALSPEEQQKIISKGKKKRQRMVEVFLPDWECESSIQTECVKSFVMELSAWSRQRAHLMAEEAGNEGWVEQLMAVVGMCEAFYILLGTVEEETIDYKTIDSWMSIIYQKSAYTNAVAEIGSRFVVDNPSKLVNVTDRTMWVGVDGDQSMRQECAFLYPSERKKLTENNYMNVWKDESRNAYIEHAMLTPLRMTQKQLILVVRERIGGEPTLKHPLIVRLEQQVENLEAIIRYPQIGKENRHEVEMVENGGVSAELRFDHADKIKWPDHLSPTSIDTLAENPLDYLMDKLLGITADGKAQMADVKTTKGNVAHAVIEGLFAPRNEARYAKPEEIEVRITNEFEEVYNRVLEAKGALLQLAENKLGEKLLHEQLRTCLETLLEILKDNELKVTGCEHYVETDMQLGLPKKVDAEGNVKERDMLGYIDMTLEDKKGHPVVFDFKWTTWSKGYQEKLKENRSVQLELYRMMLGREQKNLVERVAYFLMPEGRLYSKEAFKSRHCIQILSDNKDNIVEQLHQAAIYRREQIASGIVETNGLYDELQYVKDTEARNLFPLKKNEEKGTKEGDFFSQYGLFNK